MKNNNIKMVDIIKKKIYFILIIMSLIGELLYTILIYYLFYSILQSNNIKKTDLLTNDLISIYIIIIYSSFTYGIFTPVLTLGSLIFSLKIIKKSSLYKFSSRKIEKIQVLISTYLTYSLIKLILIRTLNIINFIYNIINKL